jgi:hypothetical protein
MPEESKTLDEAVNEAAANLAKGNTEETSNKEDAAEVSKEASELIHGLTKDELPNAAQIYQALKDPEKAKIFVKFLAENNGYVMGEQKTETKEDKAPTMEEMLLEHLGEDFAPFAAKLAPALEKIVKSQVESATTPLTKRFLDQDKENTAKEINGILESLAKENFGETKMPDKVAKEIGNLMKNFTPANGVDQKTYIGGLVKMAMSNLSLSPKNSKASRAINDPLAHLSNNATFKPNLGANGAPKKMSIDEAVMAAAESLNSKTN